jgi:hypothetical protein
MKNVLHELDVYLSEFHRGSVNIVIHFIGAGLFGYGVGIEHWVIIMTAPLVMELGHGYNYVMGKHRDLATRTLPLQIGAWFMFMTIGYIMLEIL